MSLKLKMLLLSTLLVLVIVIESGILMYGNSESLEQSEQISQVEVPILNNAHQLKLAIVQVQQWLTDISATRGLNGLDDGFVEAEKSAQQVKALFEELKLLDRENASQYDSMRKAFDLYYQEGKTMAQAYINQGPAGGNATMENFDSAAEAINKQIDPFLSLAQSKVFSATKRENETARFSRNLIIFGSLFIITCLISMTFIITKAISNLPKIVAEMASGNLDKQYDVNGTDEISLIMGTMIEMRSRLKAMVEDISSTTENLANTSEKMSQLSNSTSISTQTQFSETEQVATAMNEMTATVQEVAMNITQAASSAKRASMETDSGYQVVKDAIAEIEDLAHQIDDASMTIHQLEKDTTNITGVLDVIRGVADQTNLLALNAAIEAARAGEQGRGFAVVADEVRTLASRTQKATEEINSMIEKLIQGSRRAVDVMGKSKNQANSAVQKAAKAGESLATISSVVAQINDMNSQVATAAEEQSSVAEEINRNIVRISDMSHEVSTSVTKVKEASLDMSEMSQSLRNAVKRISNQ